MTTNEKIAALRAAAKAAGADGVLIMTSDPHCSEYLPGYYNALPWFSGFIGENSTLVVTQDRSALWCDGRFYVQADKQLAGSEIECMHAGSAGVPTVAEYLGSHFADGQTLLLDGSCVPATIAKEYIDALAKKGASLKSQDVASPIWDATGERPALPDTPCELLTPAQTGATAADRIAMVRAELQKAGATALAVTGLDCVGWLLNLRARDLPCTPLAVAYALVTMDACTLFIAPGRLSDADAATLAESGVTLRGYEEIIDAVHALPADEVFLVDEKATNYALYEALTAHKTVAGADPIFALKGIKNETELKNLRECHIRDGVAVVRFQMDLEKALAEGKQLTEIDIDTMLQKRRAEMPGYFEDSFSTIAAYGANAAMMHYHAEGDVNSVIEPRGFLLVDNGGQYDCGTTDITRTYPVGPLTDNERRYYTWVLQSHIDMARAVFLDYCTGFALDTFARGPVWAHKVNYRCGTNITEETTMELTQKTFAADEQHVKLIGRTGEAEGIRWLALSASGVEFTFTGTSAAFTIVGDNMITNAEKQPRYAVYINGEQTMDNLVDSAEATVTVFTADEAQETTVKLLKLSEAQESTMGIKDISITSVGEAKPTAEKELKIEFIGDSITCGYGVHDEDRDHHFK